MGRVGDWWNGLSSGAQSLCGCCTFIVVVISVILFGVSWHTLDPLERGIDLNTVSFAFDQEIVSNGRHFLGLGHRFVKFPITWQRVDFRPGGDAATLSSGTTDGVVNLEATVFFRFDLDSLIALYRSFGENGYRRVYIDRIQSAIKEVPSQQRFVQEDFYEKRREVEAAMAVAVEETLAEAHGEFMSGISQENRDYLCPNTTIEGPQFCASNPQVMGVFIKVGLADQISQAIINKVVADENVNTEQNRQAVSVIQAQIQVLYSDAGTNRSITLSQAQSTATVLLEEANAQALEIQLNAQQQVYERLITELDMNSTQLLNYIWLQTLQETAAGGQGRMIVGVDNPTLHFGVGTTATGGA